MLNTFAHKEGVHWDIEKNGYEYTIVDNYLIRRPFCIWTVRNHWF